LRVLDLFSGIGGFSLGLERAGMRTVAFCEIEEYPRRVLAKHWPNVPIYDDVRTLDADTLQRDGIAVDVICGGFPCQDISFAGKRAGLQGARSGLWSEYRRIIGELRPRFVIVENVPGLLSLGMGTVLGDLAALGYDATWDCIPACAVGAPHRRDRVWIVAHTNGQGEHDGAEHAEVGGAQEHVADTDIIVRHKRRPGVAAEISRGRDIDRSGFGSKVCNANVSGLAFPDRQSRDVGEKFSPSIGADWWLVEPDVGRVADGVPSRVDRLKGLGNAVVPQVAEAIGRAIMSCELEMS
jgi:DNA (cytosine-5)-methyltransferase 1